jgi:hypothetical protein
MYFFDSEQMYEPLHSTTPSQPTSSLYSLNISDLHRIKPGMNELLEPPGGFVAISTATVKFPKTGQFLTKFRDTKGFQKISKTTATISGLQVNLNPSLWCCGGNDEYTSPQRSKEAVAIWKRW